MCIDLSFSGVAFIERLICRKEELVNLGSTNYQMFSETGWSPLCGS